MNKKVYIILLNYNGWKDTIECFESVLKSDYTNYQVIVVDNDSADNSMDFIINWAEGEKEVEYDKDSLLKHLSQPFEPKPLDYVFYTREEALKGGDKEKEGRLENPLIFIQAGENGGFAAGNNIGIRYALSKGAFDYIWLLNNDTVIEKNTLSKLVSYAKQHETGICGSTLMYYHDPQRIQAYGGRVNHFLGTTGHILDPQEIERHLDYVVGTSFLIHKKVIEKIGTLPEEYFLYYEEIDYCFHATKDGFKLGTSLESIVYHKEGAVTGGSDHGENKSELSDIVSLKSRIRFHRKYLGGGIGLWLGMFISFLNRIKRGQIDRIIKVMKK